MFHTPSRVAQATSKTWPSDLAPGVDPPAVDRPYIAWRHNLITALFGSGLVLGLYVDLWAHDNIPELTTFFTPWHGLLYAAIVGSSGWFLYLLHRYRRPGERRATGMPRGYALGLLGAVLFWPAVVSDFAWHEVFGLEAGVRNALSPTHLLLLISGTLIATSPLRAAWAAEATGRATPSLREFLPTLLPLVQIAVGLSIYFWYLSAFISFDSLHNGEVRLRAPAGETAALPLLAVQSQRIGLASIVVTNLILLAPVLLLLARWHPPFGSVTAIWTAPAALMTGLQTFERGELIAVAAVAGLLADGLIQLLRPSPARTAAFRRFAALAPLALWSLYIAVERLSGKLMWPPELLVGIVVWAVASGYGLSLLMAPPGAPRGPGLR